MQNCIKVIYTTRRTNPNKKEAKTVWLNAIVQTITAFHVPLIVIPPKISENPRAASTSASTKGLGGEKHSCCSPAALINFYYSVLVCPPPPSFRPQTACPITRPRFLVLSSKLGSQSQPVSRTQLLPRPYTQLWVGLPTGMGWGALQRAIHACLRPHHGFWSSTLRVGDFRG